jgi:predicted RNase H-like HicB family nuclease
MDTHIYNLQIRVLIYREDGEWVARALEMDLLGFGKTEREAAGELQQAVEAQISFAHQTNDASLINFPAEPEFFKRWEEAQKKAMRSEILGDKSVKLAARAQVISFTAAELKVLRTRRFKETGLVCA